ncbi:hypothetical protein HOF56_02235 [Candidatus Peribacteria bacterium]|jgi:hypothetical protein|nr:hypothetical protein [Candidatus Peribacteria bacterium]MBT4021456.1 hypothetical protein [Candidatus Peribacteria bacterium]MBT4240366.1 hypothetical protein [Candidatus Peribacteria bacterium]MBT4473789.1 hypothetical protein [Candidatus Peribacteria bacterium]
MFSERKTVTLLRPSDTSWEAAMRQSENGSSYCGDGMDVYGEYTDNSIDSIRDEVCRLSEELNILARVEDFQISYGQSTPGRKRMKFLNESDVIAAYDPSDCLTACIYSILRTRPEICALFAYSCRDALEASYHIVGAVKVPVFENGTESKCELGDDKSARRKFLPRAFAFFTQNENLMRNAIEQALIFPNGKLIDVMDNTNL